MSELFDEIEAELRSDRLKAFWDKYGSAIIIALLAIVVLVAERIFTVLIELRKILKLQKNMKRLCTIGDASRRPVSANFGFFGLKITDMKIAAFRKARLLHQSGDTDAAVNAYDVYPMMAPCVFECAC